MAKRRLPELFYNPLSIGGAALAAVSFAAIVFLTFVEIFQERAPAYIGIISYVALPVPLVFGLLLVPIGMMRERRRRLRGMPASRLIFTLDLNSARQRNGLLTFSTVTVVLLLFTAYGSYRAFEWTESVEFCGTTCHTVMEPEHTAYLHSPHARVKCVDCHVGPGAGWYVRSKLSGAYQVYAVLANVYPRPIPTPIANLRPAQETCEQCHWPSHFSGEKKYVNTYFRSDEKNSRWTVALLMKTGGGNPERGPAGGIHWHMNIANEITYVALDSLRQVIPYVRLVNKATGAVEEYTSTDATLDSSQRATLRENRMDCIDCHNRPSHIYRPPVRIVDRSMASGHISTELPSVRQVAVQALVQPYSSKEAAMDSIPKIFNAFYQEQHPEVLQEKVEALKAAVEEVRVQYGQNFFPRMNVSWRVYPNNIGHMTDVGCFRCHDNKHVSASGRTISKDCNVCHTLLYQGSEAEPKTFTTTGLEFQHPDESIGDVWKETNCRDCHSGE